MSAIYTPRFQPWHHQQEAEDKWGDREYFALFMAMRTGKTKVVIDHYGKNELKGNIQNLCVLAPGGVYKTWEGQCLDHFSADLRERALIHVWESGAGVKKSKRLDYFMNTTDKPRVFLMNVEALSSVKEARDTIVDFLSQGTVLTAIDESTVIGNMSSKRTDFINDKVSNPSDMRVIMTGLPTPKDPLSLYTQLYFLDWRILGNVSYYSFRARYAKMAKLNVPIPGGGFDKDGNPKKRKITIITGFKDLDKLQEKVAKHSHRTMLKDVYDVPDKVYMIREVELTKEQERIYADLKRYMTAQLDEMSHVTATIVVAQIIRLHQVLCGHTVDEEGIEHDIPENRTKELIELLSEYDGKAIIWCSYDYDVQKVTAALEKEFGKGCAARFWGGNRNTREAEEVRFRDDDNVRFMVATAAAGGRGREWKHANLVVYYSNTDNLDHRDQSEERAQAVGKLDPVTYVDLVTRGTVDEKFLKSMREKINMATAITGDNYREWVI